MKSNVMCGIAFLRTVWGCAFVGISACRNVRKCCIVSGLIADYCWLNWLVSTFGTITRLKGNYITKSYFCPSLVYPQNGEFSQNHRQKTACHKSLIIITHRSTQKCNHIFGL